MRNLGRPGLINFGVHVTQQKFVLSLISKPFELTDNDGFQVRKLWKKIQFPKVVLQLTDGLALIILKMNTFDQYATKKRNNKNSN